MKETKRQRWKRGAVVRIRLDERRSGYGQMLDEPEYAFFGVRDDGASPAEKAAAHPVIFRLWVTRGAHSSGRWEKIGIAAMQKDLESPVLRFNQDALDPERIQLSEHGTGGISVTPEQCEQYECGAVWDASHVEDRLRDHFEGRRNAWSESLRPTRSRPTSR